MSIFTFSGERALRSRQHERGTSQERRYKRSNRRSPSSSRQHGHRERDRERERQHLQNVTRNATWARRSRLQFKQRHTSASPSQERHRHRSPSTKSQVSNKSVMWILSSLFFLLLLLRSILLIKCLRKISLCITNSSNNYIELKYFGCFFFEENIVLSVEKLI